MSEFFSFPDPVNKVAARTVAAGVAMMATFAMIFDQHVTWLLVVLAYGFVARVRTGPTMSPLGQVATRVVAPHSGIPPKLVPGVPKRFAQGIGVVFSVSALALTLAGAHVEARVVLALLLAAALLESAFAYCLGCRVFAVLMQAGIIPDSVCERCTNLTLAPPA